jgi:DNA-binding IclR family transcriptional regulator
VTSKVAAVFDAFSPSDPELTLNELSRLTGLPLSTTYRIVSELVDWGGLERVEGGGYRIGLRLWEIGSLAPVATGLRDVALPFLQDLYEATHENVHLAVRDGLEALYVVKVTGRRSISVKTRQGERLPLHATGAGRVLLAFGPPELLEKVLATGLTRYTPHTVVAPGPLKRDLAEIRRTGVAFVREELTLGRVSVASPMLDGEGNVVAAISIAMSSAHANLQRLGPAVRTAALCASRRLRSLPARS